MYSADIVFFSRVGVFGGHGGVAELDVGGVVFVCSVFWAWIGSVTLHRTDECHPFFNTVVRSDRDHFGNLCHL